MIERLLIPSWNTPPRSLDDWRERLDALGQPAEVQRDGPDELWLVLEPLATRLLAVMEGPSLAALHAEINAPDPGPALALLDEAARGLGWEVHDDEHDADDED